MEGIVEKKRKDTMETIQKAKGHFFSVEFNKRTTGEIRKMICRRGVSKGVTGVGLAYDPMEKGLCTVWDVEAKTFRSINLDGIIRINSEGITWEYEV